MRQGFLSALYDFNDRVEDVGEFLEEVRDYLAGDDLEPIRAWLEDTDDEDGPVAELAALLDDFEQGALFPG